jgi:hypothetical protein
VSVRRRARVDSYGYLVPEQERQAGDPTEYELAVASLSPEALKLWVRRNYLSRYVPEETLEALGLKAPD